MGSAIMGAVIAGIGLSLSFAMQADDFVGLYRWVAGISLALNVIGGLIIASNE